MSSSQVPQPVHVLSPDLVGVLKNRVEATLVALIKKNKHTRYFSESPVFAAFHSAIRDFGREDYDAISDDILLEAFRTTIPFTNYNSYEPFVAKFLTETCQEDDVRDMFSPGLPHHIAVTSSTSSPKPKFFCKYQHQDSMRRNLGDSGEIFWTFSLHYRQLVKIQDRNGDIIKTVPAGLGSSGGVRMLHGLEVENDHSNIKLAGTPRHSTLKCFHFIVKLSLTRGVVHFSDRRRLHPRLSRILAHAHTLCTRGWQGRDDIYNLYYVRS
ncbi:hypothetical protein M404DRAFT_464795 [Pisolithus tinctorius Marx 270]|uniref:Uncharacterized protein n=1 Tax=Pisolithus tinctorius Marx 270 TaxID=870435 RepID=A0A0C3KX99_PISTI|nr:hypothetical protein M404DRAFT_464795 [Pisolithus tinctorius Marx 270]